jgi:hypothetical protein
MSTTESVESVQSLEATVDLEAVLEALKEFGCADLFKVIKIATIEAEKRVKSKPKKEDAPKKATPKQLQKSTAWVKFTFEYSVRNGWEEFIVCNRKSGEEILMPASEEIDGKHVYPNGKEMILTHAMSLSKQRWSPKAKEGTHEELYNEFSAAFDAHVAEEPEEEEEEVVKPVIVRKTAEEKAAELAAKKAELEEAKAVAKAAREAKSAAAKQEKAELAAKEKAEKAKAKAKVPAAAVKVVVKAKAPAAAVAKPALKKPVVVWSCPADGAVHPWTYKGAKYLRNSDHQVWREDAEGGCGDWCGVYLIDEDRIDDSVEEPDFE